MCILHAAFLSNSLEDLLVCLETVSGKKLIPDASRTPPPSEDSFRRARARWLPLRRGLTHGIWRLHRREEPRIGKSSESEDDSNKYTFSQACALNTNDDVRHRPRINLNFDTSVGIFVVRVC